MAYISDEGGMSIEDQIPKEAPEGKFRVIVIDNYEGSYETDDLDTLELARKRADEAVGPLVSVAVYDDKGTSVYRPQWEESDSE